ncbi:MAG: TonB-dependent receptor [Saprospiraceae bacterium]|nr:TonB-dependent receptor [Saprospiraceae bacterium]MCF8252686.1 TonB-dependent receptor [Saprospiraceae bacterium]MCF8282993.1 TonB-dependent receptor [Bacteroidales bacterium]MCF8314259.1 TonB-dependent receptor [Saprospiraceae bacterium]MCF8443098.1 TonB-dependent receptor [Saprospiraceae bacterium]
MKFFNLCLVLLVPLIAHSQSANIKGQLKDAAGAPVIFANVALFSAADSVMKKVEPSDENGFFQLSNLAAGEYFLVATNVGMPDLRQQNIQLDKGKALDLGVLAFKPAAVDLAEVTVSASRALVEIKPDRTIFNVEGTINSVGADALTLLRKAPGVTVDNQDNVNVLGRAGVLVYVDGKRLPLSGQELSNYLQNLQADQIDRFEIITNPGAKYEAEGNAGIIDIRLKKDKNLGANGSVNATFSQGRYARANTSASGNYRNKVMNTFGTLGLNDGSGYMDMDFLSYQNGLVLDEINNHKNDNQGINYRFGTDFFLSEKSTIGFLIDGGNYERTNESLNRIGIAKANNPEQVDSLLVANNTNNNDRTQRTYNLNYRFDPDHGQGKGRSLNIDLDYGQYVNKSKRYQPNRYYDANEQVLLTEVINSYNTPSDIDIYTAKLDYEEEILGGKLGVGGKVSKVVSDNTFLVFDVENDTPVQNDRLSNKFKYDENVYAGYVNFARPLGKKWNLSAGLRAEKTDAMGDLKTFLPELQEEPVELNYMSWFPSAGLTWQVAEQHNLTLNYGRRINRPDYNVLNPFNNQISQLSYEKGNPFLRPEIVNNLELGYTLKYRYNAKIAYSRTTDQITRLIGPDENDPRAGFITWANLAEQTIWSANISAPVDITEKWNAYVNLSGSHQDNQADYGDGAVVNVQAFSYNIYMQNTITLPLGFKGEVSGWFSGPGIWGGVFKYKTSWSLDLGLQRKFLQERLNVRLSASDIFFKSGWRGYSEFNGLTSYGNGNWDARRVSASVSYNFGNDKVKSRKRSTGLEEEGSRVGSGQ